MIFCSLAFLLALWRNGQLVAPIWDVMLVHEVVRPGSQVLPDSFISALHAGYYYFGPMALGCVISPFGEKCVDNWLIEVQVLLWASQIWNYRRISERVAGRGAATNLSVLLFGWGVPLFYVADIPYAPTASLGRSMGLAFGLWSIALYLEDMESWAWVVAAVGVYAHPGPCAVILLYYAAVEGWATLQGPHDYPDYLSRLLIAATILIPVIDFQLTSPPLPSVYRPIAHAAHGPAVLVYGWSSWVLTLVGGALVALGSKQTSSKARGLISWALPLLALRFAVRLFWFPRGLPLSDTLLGLTSGFSAFTVAQYVGLPIVCGWICRSLRPSSFFMDKAPRLVAKFALFFLALASSIVHSPYVPLIEPQRPTCGRDDLQALFGNTGAAAIPYARGVCGR